MQLPYRNLAILAVADGITADLSYELSRYSSQFERKYGKDFYDAKEFYNQVEIFCAELQADLYKKHFGE
jgi:hypothetical protein